jgi:hypothetical protein
MSIARGYGMNAAKHRREDRMKISCVESIRKQVRKNKIDKIFNEKIK